MKVLQLSIVWCVLSAICAREITGGKQKLLLWGDVIGIKRAPFQVSMNKRGRHHCGGSIIAEDIILTAAHCVLSEYSHIPESSSDLKVRVGSSKCESGGLLVPVASFIYHPKYPSYDPDYDIALLKLKTPLKYSAAVQPICMTEKDAVIADGATVNVTGWGETELGMDSPVLRQVSVNKANDDACRRNYDRIGVSITPRMLCAGVLGGGKDSCSGDSGGPLVHNGKLVGVVSFGKGCGQQYYPGVYAKVSALRTWIDVNMRRLAR